MLLVWSTTEVIRYPFYTFTLLGGVPYQLLWLRYTTFYLLYPIGAISEAVAVYATLPVSSQWNIYDYVRTVLFVVWWPCKISELLLLYPVLKSTLALYVLYTYMIKQRRKVLKKAKTVKRE
jgi:very-long-chain (3R)-3-hydroxyacyl-CoA dehydratase